MNTFYCHVDKPNLNIMLGNKSVLCIKAVFRIGFILVRILGSVSVNNGSGFNFKSDLKTRKYQQQKVHFFFHQKYDTPIYDLFCYLLAYYLGAQKKCNLFVEN